MPVTRCRVSGCTWFLRSPSQLERDRSWSEHYESQHAQHEEFTTRCTDPPGCGWSATGRSLPELRRLRAEHVLTHSKELIR